MSKERANKFRHRKRAIPAVITAAAFAATLAAPASALTPSASSASQVAQAATSSSASSSSPASQTSSETSSVVSSSAVSGSTASSFSSAVNPTASSQTSSTESKSSSTVSKTQSQASNSSTSSNISSQLQKNSVSDTTPPTLNSISIDKTQVTAPGSVTITADVTDDLSGVETVGIYYHSPTNNTISVYLNYNASIGKYQGTLNLSSYAAAGKYTLYFIGLDDRAGNNSTLYPSNISQNIDFTATSSQGDTTPPKLNNISIDKTQVTAPGSIIITADVTDDLSGVETVGIYYHSPTNNTISVYLNYNASIGKYQGTLNLSSYAAAGKYTLYFIGLDDKAGNNSTLYPSNISQNIDFSVVTSNITPLTTTYTTQNETWSNRTVNGDLYVGPQSVLTLTGTTTITGNVYVLGAIQNYSNLNVTGTIYASNFNWGYSSSLTNGTVEMLGGTSSINNMVATDHPIDSIPLTVYTNPIKPTNGTVSLQGATLPVMDLYINGQKLDLNGDGTFDVKDFPITYGQNLKFEFKDVFGDVIDKTYSVQWLDTNLQGVSDNGIYSTERAITFQNATATLDGKTFSSGGTVSNEGKHTLIITDTDGNSTTISFTIDKTAPTVTIGQYDGTDPTNKPITVTATTGSDATFSAATGETVSADGHTASYTFSKNGSFTFTTTDAAGNTASKTVTITNIDTTPPTIAVGSYNTNPTNKPITVTATTGSDATFSTATGETVSADGHTASYTFSKNGSFTFAATDAAGNTTSKTVTITNIDTTPPTVTIGQYDGTDPTNKPITLIATTGSDAAFSAATGETVSADGHTASYTFSKNGSFTFMATDAAGNTTSKAVTISNIIQNSNAQPLTDIDSPSNGATVNGTMNVSGWALNVSGINRVDVYAFDSNGKPHSLGSVASKNLTDRGDVAKTFANAGYANINNSGYSLSVDTTKLPNGTYTLAVAGIGNSGVVQWATESIYVTTPQPLTDIDSPANGSTVSGTIHVAGWALNVSGINRVDVYAWDSNGKPHSLGSMASKDLTDRGDVAKAFANDGYGNINNSGYSLSADTTKLADGTYTLAVAGIGNNGVVQWATETIKVTTPQPLTDIDSPANGSTVSGTIHVAGWALNVSGINRVDVYAWDSNGKPHSLGSVASKDLTDRGDVAKAFANNGYGNINNSGYSLSVDTTQLSNSTYTLAVAGIGNNGVVQWATKTVTVQ